MKTLALILALAAGLTACSAADTAHVDETIDDATAAGVETAEAATGTTLTESSAESIAKVQTTLDVLTAELDGAEVGQSVEAAWSEVQVRVTDAVVSAQSEAEFDESALGDSLDTFEERLEEAVPSPELWSAWNEFRAAVTDFVAST